MLLPTIYGDFVHTSAIFKLNAEVVGIERLNKVPSQKYFFLNALGHSEPCKFLQRWRRNSRS
jgi:hypothetical protein